MSQENSRKRRVMINKDKFGLIKKFYKFKTKTELLEITGVSRSSLNKIIARLSSEGGNDLTFENAFKKTGRKIKNKENLHCEIRNVMGNDNSLTQTGCLEKLTTSISKTTLCREIKFAGLSSKGLKKRSSVVLTKENQNARRQFCATMLGKLSRTIFF